MSPDNICPKCGALMEAIETGMEPPPLEDVQLCPRCYLVTWSDRDGLHARQGIPMKKGSTPERPAGPRSRTEEC
jgi:hypothetical protein